MRCLMPFEILIIQFSTEKSLVVLGMQNSNIKELWNQIKLLNKMKIQSLTCSKNLVKTPNFHSNHCPQHLQMSGGKQFAAAGETACPPHGRLDSRSSCNLCIIPYY